MSLEERRSREQTQELIVSISGWLCDMIASGNYDALSAMKVRHGAPLFFLPRALAASR